MNRLHAVTNAEQLTMLKLQQQIQNVENQKQLEVIEQELIKNYKMIEGDYKASELTPKPDSYIVFNADKEHCNSFVKVETMEEQKKTNVKKQTNNPIFDEHFHFSFNNLRKEDLDNATIKFTVYDRSSLIIKKAITGTVQLDWTSIYFRRNHEIYRGWLTISDPDEEVDGITGYLLVNIAILGPNDRVTIHDSKYIKDPLTTLQQTITIRKLKTVDYSLRVQVFRAQHLVPINGVIGGADAFITAKFSGKKVKTSRIRSANPEWNQLLKINTSIPTRSKYLLIQVWNWSIVGHDLIGVIKIPFTDIIEKKTIGPQWMNIYGSPMSGKDKQPFNYATAMQIDGQQLGSHYRGRLLLKIQGFMDVYTKTQMEKILFKFPFKPVPNVPQRGYVFRAAVIQGTQLPRQKGRIQITMGPYMLTSQTQNTDKNGCCGWFENITEKRVVFPCQDNAIDQLPDIIIYFNTGQLESQRVSFLRVKASKIIQNCYSQNIITYQLQPDRSLGALQPYQTAGFVALKIQLFTAIPPPPKNLQQLKAPSVNYQIRIYLYLAQSLPPANVTGDCDSMIQFKCAGKKQKSSTKWKTRNPTWYKTIVMDVELQQINKTTCQRGIVCLVYDQDSKRKNFIGKFWMPIVLNNKIHYKSKKGGFQIIYQKPKWFHITNPNKDFPQCKLGKVLIGYSLMQASDVSFVDIPVSLKPRSQQAKIQIYVIGLRSIEQQWKNAKAKFSFTDAQSSIQTIEAKIKHGGCVFNSLFKSLIYIPHNRNLAPFMDISIDASKQGDNLSFAAYNSISLYQLIPNFFKLFQSGGLQKIDEQKQDQNSEQSLLNVGKLQKQLDIIKLRRKRLQQLEDKQFTNNYRHVTFDKLPMPDELRKVSTSEVSTILDNDFNTLITKFEEQFVSGKQYDYVRRLEKQSDKVQLGNKNKDLRFKVQKQFNDDESSELLNNSLHFSQLNKKRGQTFVIQQQKREDFDIFDATPIKINSDMEETRLMTKKIEANSIATLNKSVLETTNRFKQASRRNFDQDAKSMKSMKSAVGIKDAIIDGFSIGTSDVISSANQMNDRVIGYQNIKKAHAQQKQHQQMARNKQMNSKFAAAVKLSLFQWANRKKKIEDEQTYEDFDTDPGQDLDITPEWYKGRRILSSDFQDIYQPTKKLKEVQVFSGGDFIEGQSFRIPRRIATLKFIVLAYDKQQQAEEKSKYYNRIMSPKIYLCRLYFLKGKSLISEFHDKPTTSLRIHYGSQTFNLKDKTLNQSDSNPEYYVCQDILVELPGPATIRVEVVEHRKVLKDHVLGYTDIDLQRRYFTRKWHLMLRKPIQLRNLYSDYGIGSQGRLQTWVQIIERKDWQNHPAEKIHPPPHQQFELRVIVWQTKDCVIKDQAEQCNDIFVRGWVGTCQHQDTDVHWRCRGVGSFNWRWKFPVVYPPTPEDVYGDMFTVQIWDKDVIGYNELIGQTRINLNKVHRIIEKAVKRNKPTRALMKIIQRGMDVTQKMYYHVYNDKKLDEFGNKISQGRVLLSFQLVPAQQSKQKYLNGTGRSEPNLHPTLPQPEGRLSFSCRHPWDFLKQIFGLKFLKKCSRWCLIAFLAILVIIVIVFIISQAIAGDGNKGTVNCVLYNATTNTIISRR